MLLKCKIQCLNIFQLLKKTLDEFVSSWLKEITINENFQQELKDVVRNAASEVLKRGLKVRTS